ncbi:unnamed protein product [Bursaphelenchus okinawaensis]|uniref:Uncharacterized protein n=1 Tax=Bursaphelenchus okinawaensis TaxID=465554 RepID=A0A811KB77_9BILA|nr:unnamed protein product [Bursaphelenchus okinawaensis]CAG9100753.1 unnamed protein product [Bursaphelenchus okinawaensis]
MDDSESPGSTPTHRITIEHVYDFASELTTTVFDDLKELIGKEQAREYFLKFQPAFEYLEILVKRTEKDHDKIGHLERTIEDMERDRQLRARKMEDREKELLELEELYGKENKNLWEMVNKVKEENKYLQSTMERLAEETVEEKEKQVLAAQEFELLRNLKQQNLELKDKIKEQQEQLNVSEETEKKLRANIEELITETEKMLRKNKSLESQCRTLFTERNNYVKAQEELKEHNLRLKQTLDQTSRACNDLKNQQDIQLDKDRVSDDYALKFSTNDLRTILHENTQLKSRLYQLEERLDRPQSSSGESGTETATETASVAVESVADFSEVEAEERGEDEVVYGPINKEPDEKLYPWKYQRKSSGIAKLFSKLFS